MSKNDKDKTTEMDKAKRFEKNLLNRDLFLNLGKDWKSMPTAIKSIQIGFRTGTVSVTRGVLKKQDHAYVSLGLQKTKPVHLTDYDQFLLLKELVNNPDVEELIKECEKFNVYLKTMGA